MKWLLGVATALAVIAAAALLGLKVRPRPFGAPAGSRVGEQAELLPNLPAPVARWAKEVAVDGLPKIDSAVIVGGGVMRIGPLELPVRFRGEYHPAREYWRTMEVTWMRLPVTRGLDTYVGGVGKMTIAGQTSAGPEMDQGANMAVYAEAVWLPSVLLTDRRLRWEPIDDAHARLVFPFKDGTDSLVFEFDRRSGRPLSSTAMRYKAGESEKTEWIGRTVEWRRVRGMLVPTKTDVRWGDADKPWATFEIQDIALNVPVPGLEGASGN